MGSPTFREFRKSDIVKCVDITAEAWPELKPGGLDLATIEWYGRSSTWREVACISDVPVGMLFGKIFSEMGFLGGSKTSISHATVYLKMLLGLYGRIPHRFAYLKGGIIGDKDIAENSPDTDGEITFFVVDSAHRGMGIGRQLLSRYVAHAKKMGSKTIAVYTTEPGSDLRFYENQGFKRYSQFRDGFMSVVRNEEVKAMFYTLDLG
jgi:GNAT superfamily N-acetyltransferase